MLINEINAHKYHSKFFLVDTTLNLILLDILYQSQQISTKFTSNFQISQFCNIKIVKCNLI